MLPLNSTISAITDPEPGLRRQVLAHSSAMMLVRHEMRKGWRGTAHKHPQEQLVYVISGHIRIVIDGKTIEASAGESFIVGSNIEHQATALEECVVLDVFSPIRHEYL
jgi:quercetin dioxygenase-like cupin family protein